MRSLLPLASSLLLLTLSMGSCGPAFRAAPPAVGAASGSPISSLG